MAESGPRDRLQPFLIDRLTDDQPGVAQESRDHRVFSPRQMQASVLRDLGWLLNARAHRPEDGLDEYPEAARSVLNFGIPDLAGLRVSTIDTAQLERTVLQAIRNFEPRLVPQTLQVKMVKADQKGHTPNVMSFEIRGELRANPLSEPLYIKTEVDLETGQFVLKDR